jgi:eukaryotic-like serine/threonine-protein kinase
MNRDSTVHVDSIGADVRIDVHLDVGDGRGSRLAGAASGPLAPTDRTVHAGRIVGGRYELVRLLGRGSMGAVWLANHITLGEQVALKLMAPMDETDAVEDATTSAARFRFEAQIAARLSRKTGHVVRVTDHGQEGPVPYLVMELLDGQTLERALICRGRMGLVDVAELVTQIARGLEAAHSEGILHRDLKPANVFLAESSEGKRVVKLLDFGVARGHGSQRLGSPFATAKGLIVGTLGYMSPEQAAASEIDVRSDLWALAAIAYEALTCELPVAGADAEHMLSNLRAGLVVPIRERRPDLPEAIERFFERAFAPRIDDRYGTCAELAGAFQVAVGLGMTPAVTRRMPVPPSPRLAGPMSPALSAPLSPRLAAPLSPDLSASLSPVLSTPSPHVEAGARAITSPHARLAAVALVAWVGLLGAWYAAGGSWRSKPSSDAAALAALPAEGQGAAARTTDGERPPPQAASQDSASALWTQAATPPPLTPTQRAPAVAPPTAGGLGEFKAYY